MTTTLLQDLPRCGQRASQRCALDNLILRISNSNTLDFSIFGTVPGSPRVMGMALIFMFVCSQMFYQFLDFFLLHLLPR